jgi:hypothetical protein
MGDRVKFQVMGLFGWRTAYCMPHLLMASITLMRLHGIQFRVVNREPAA